MLYGYWFVIYLVMCYFKLLISKKINEIIKIDYNSPYRRK